MIRRPAIWLQSPPLAEAMLHAALNQGSLAPESKARQYIQSRHVLTPQKSRRASKTREYIDTSYVPVSHKENHKMSDELWEYDSRPFISSLLRFLGNAHRVPGAPDTMLVHPIQNVDSY